MSSILTEPDMLRAASVCLSDPALERRDPRFRYTPHTYDIYQRKTRL